MVVGGAAVVVVVVGTAVVEVTATAVVETCSVVVVTAAVVVGATVEVMVVIDGLVVGKVAAATFADWDGVADGGAAHAARTSRPASARGACLEPRIRCHRPLSLHL